MERLVPVLVLRPPPQEGIGAYFRTYAGYVNSIALRLLGRREEVDDVVQEVFLAAIDGISQLRDPAAVKTWLATVTTRIACRRLRARRVRSFLGLDKTAHYAELAVRATQEQTTLVHRVYRILDDLPVNHRVAWTLRNVEGERLEAVATICRCSLATAKRRIAAAQEAIEQAVRDE